MLLVFSRFVPVLEKKANWSRRFSKVKEEKRLPSLGLLALENQHGHVV